MRFVDYVKVKVKAGDGGRGCVSFRREKYVPKGGPDGGDGGRGGHIIFRATDQLNTLLDLKYKHEYRAGNGQHGKGKKMHGKNGKDCIVTVPVGTLIKDASTDVMLIDLDKIGSEAVIAQGGKGGLGNAHFATSTRQAPRYAQKGETGDMRNLIIELKLLADVGLIGLPNAGKSTFLSAISSARPKIAEYPFTTLVPVLGVVKLENYRSFVVADIPGLIEGAHRGVGLGFQFLRHIERTSILLHLIDISEMGEGDPIEHFKKVNKELEHYNPLLMKRPQVVVGTKLDVAGDRARLNRLAQYCKKERVRFYSLSAVSRKGIRRLISYLSVQLRDRH
jgi:GTP-binding protein